ncbi:MAG: hypothetical protein NZ576_11705 [Bacteroidia bacterium]|nr:hypothetical protein [Bacteroidia bacterium]
MLAKSIFRVVSCSLAKTDSWLLGRAERVGAWQWKVATTATSKLIQSKGDQKHFYSQLGCFFEPGLTRIQKISKIMGLNG